MIYIFSYWNYRLKESLLNLCPEEALVEDAKHYFARDSPSVAKITDETVDINFDDENQEFLSPVVST